MTAKNRRNRPQQSPAPKVEEPLTQLIEEREKRIHARMDEIRIELRRLEDERTDLVKQLRALRTTWEEIGEITGTSRAGAHRKWGPSTKPE